MEDVTEALKKEQKYIKALTKIKNEIQSKVETLENEKKNSWVCKKCKHRFLKPVRLDKKNAGNYFIIPPSDADIILKNKHTEVYSEWTTSGYDYYNASAVDIFIKCPHCGHEEKQYTQRLEQGQWVDSKDSW